MKRRTSIATMSPKAMPCTQNINALDTQCKPEHAYLETYAFGLPVKHGFTS